MGNIKKLQLLRWIAGLNEQTNLAIEFFGFILIISILLLSVINSAAQDFRDAPPGETWRTIQSEHFSITFPEKDRQIAQKLINIAESYYSRMTERMAWVPDRETFILVSNATDSANGETTPYYYDHIVIFAVPPDAYSSIINYADWVKTIFTHEYTHVLHLDQVRGFFGFINGIFGRVLFVNDIQPDWFIEGYAVYNESTLTGAGRDNGSYYNTVLMSQALKNDLPSIDVGNGTPSKWPFGEYPYLYGGKFLQYLASKYPAKSFADYSERYTYLPLLISRDSKLAFDDKDFTELWQEWQDMLRKQALLTALSVLFTGYTGSRQATYRGAYTRGPVWDTTGRGIYYTSYDGRSRMGLFYTDIAGKHGHRTARRNSGFSSSVCNDRLLFSQEDYFKNFYLYSDLYELDTATGCVKRLTHGLRVRGADVSYDCKKAVFVSNTSTMSDLMVYHLAGTDSGSNQEKGRASAIARLDSTGQFLNPRWSWDGKQIAVAVKNNNGESSIEIMNEQGETLTTVISDYHLNLFPSWSRDNRYVLFSSDRTGIPNLYAYAVTQHTIYQVSNVIGGAYESQVSPDNATIAFTQYDESGFNIYTMPFSPSTFKPVYLAKEFTVEQVRPYKQVKTEEKAYSPFDTLRPTWWLPTLTLANDAYTFGIYTAGSDLLAHHTYSVLVDYTEYPDVKKSPGFSADYINTSFAPEIEIQGSMLPYIASTYKDPSSNEHSYVQQSNNIALNVSCPMNRVRYRQAVGAGYSYTFRKSLTPLPAYVEDRPFTGKLSGFTADYSIDTTSVYDTSISREDGVYFNTHFERDISVLGSDRDLSMSFSALRLYIPGFAVNNVVFIKGIYGFSAGVSKNDALFAVGGVQSLYANPDYTDLPVRGYSPATLTGTKAYAVSVEYRYLAGIVDRGITTLPFYLDKVSLSPFFDIGTNTYRTISSTGVELNLDTYIAYVFPVRFVIGYAYAYNAYPPSSWYFLVGETIL